MRRQGNGIRALASAICASVFKRSRVERARRSRRVTISTSPSSISLKGAAQLRAVGLCAAGCFLKNFLGSGGAQLLRLRVNALAVRGYPCIAVNHGMILHRTFATGKPFLINGLFLVRKS